MEFKMSLVIIIKWYIMQMKKIRFHIYLVYEKKINLQLSRKFNYFVQKTVLNLITMLAV